MELTRVIIILVYTLGVHCLKAELPKQRLLPQQGWPPSSHTVQSFRHGTSTVGGGVVGGGGVAVGGAVALGGGVAVGGFVPPGGSHGPEPMRMSAQLV